MPTPAACLLGPVSLGTLASGQRHELDLGVTVPRRGQLLLSISLSHDPPKVVTWDLSLAPKSQTLAKTFKYESLLLAAQSSYFVSSVAADKGDSCIDSFPLYFRAVLPFLRRT